MMKKTKGKILVFVICIIALSIIVIEYNFHNDSYKMQILSKEVSEIKTSNSPPYIENYKDLNSQNTGNAGNEIPSHESTLSDTPSENNTDSNLAENYRSDVEANAVLQKTDAKPSVLLDAPLIDQNPELYNGCEITSLTMLMNYLNIDVNKMELASGLAKDSTPMERDRNGNISTWGDPKIGFVGSMTQDYGGGITVDPEPIVNLMANYMDNPVNLTGSDINTLKQYLLDGKPVVAWITNYFLDPEFITWTTPKGREVISSFDVHAVLLTGYDDKNIYYNDPLDVEKNASIDADTFEYIWTIMGSKAVSYN